MWADAGTWLAIGSALFLTCAIAVVALCLTALLRGAEFEGEIQARPLRFHMRTAPGQRRNGPGSGSASEIGGPATQRKPRPPTKERTKRD